MLCRNEHVNRGPDWYDPVDAISAATGHKLARTPVEVVSGGGVSACLRWTSDLAAAACPD